MGEVVHVLFGTERMWDQAHQNMTDVLLRVGALFGDDETLLRAKADRAHALIRSIAEDMPTVDIEFEIPDNLTAAQRELITKAVRAAACRGSETAIVHSIKAVSDALYDLCTSRLAENSQPVKQ